MVLVQHTSLGIYGSINSYKSKIGVLSGGIMHSAPSSYLLYVLQVVFTWPYTVYIFFTAAQSTVGGGGKVCK